jgi:putative tryptophan/tyrosine transport system substrate-binding protein
MRRIGLAVVLAVSLILAPLATWAQTPAKVPRVSVVSFGHVDALVSRDGKAAFEAGLREAGWMPESTIAVKYYWANADRDQLARHVAEIVRSAPDLIVARTGQAQRAISGATSTIPIVLGGAADPVAQGFVKSLARPGGNVTGLSLQDRELVPKRIELLKEILPHLKRVAVLASPSSYFPWTPEANAAVRALGLDVQRLTIKSPAELPQAFSTIGRSRAGAVVVSSDGGATLDREISQLVSLAAAHRLPAIYAWRQHVESGGLMTYTIDLADVQRQAARYVDKILKGAKPADLPVEQPTKFELVINFQTAKALGLTIPQTLLQRADQVIQ